MEEKAACTMVPRQERVGKELWLTAVNVGRLTKWEGDQKIRWGPVREAPERPEGGVRFFFSVQY